MKNKLGWKQVRIFTKHRPKDNSWALQILGDVIRPVVSAYPKMRFWFSIYHCSLTLDGELGEFLPDEFIDLIDPRNERTRSLRFRFKPTHERHIEYLEELMKSYDAEYWYAGVKPYDHFYDLCGTRFSTRMTKSERKQRGELVQKLLEYNSRLILDCLENRGMWVMETNDNPNNTAFGNISRSIIHMIVNPWLDNKRECLPIYGIDWSAIYNI